MNHSSHCLVRITMALHVRWLCTLLRVCITRISPLRDFCFVCFKPDHPKESGGQPTSWGAPASRGALSSAVGPLSTFGHQTIYNATHVEELESALRAIPWKSTDGVRIGSDPILQAEGAKMYEAVRAGQTTGRFSVALLMSYGPDLPKAASRAAYYVDKILRGAKSSDLLVEQISQVDLVIDLRVARELGVKVPSELLFRADRVTK